MNWLGVLEREEASSSYRWQAAGNGIARLLLCKATNMTFAVGWPDFERRTLVTSLDRVTDRLQPFVARLRAASRDCRAVGLELLALPIESRDDASIQVLCGIFPFGEPDWLGRTALASIELTGLRAIRTEPCPRTAVTAPQRPLGEPVALRVIRGGLAD